MTTNTETGRLQTALSHINYRIYSTALLLESLEADAVGERERAHILSALRALRWSAAVVSGNILAPASGQPAPQTVAPASE